VRWALRLVDPTLGSEVAFVISLSAFHFNRIDRSKESIAVSMELIFVPRSLVAEAGAADAGRHMVADQLATAVGEDRRPAHPACALLLVAAG
jgi:hypothetical protein